MTIAVFGDFKKKDIRLMILKDKGTQPFVFQNILKEAGFDCVLFSYTTDEVVKLLNDLEKEK